MIRFRRAVITTVASAGALAAAAAIAQSAPPAPSAPGAATPGAMAPAGAREAAPAGQRTLPRPQTNWTPAAENGLPGVKEVNGIRYVTGGFGQTESNALRDAIPQYRLSMVFSQASGAYVANIPVRIRGNGNAPSLEVTAEGPYLLIDLPAGRYRIQATHDGRELTRDVTVSSGRGQRVGFAW